MSEKPISPLRQRMLEDMSLRGFDARYATRLPPRCQEAGGLFGPVSRHRDDRRPTRVPTAPDRERRSAADHQRDGDGAAVLLQGDARPAGDDATSRIRLRAAQAAARALARGGVTPAGGGPGPKHKAALSVAYGAGLRAMEVVALKVCDIDSKRMMLRVEQGKGRKSLPSRKRGIVLPCCRRSYWSCSRLVAHCPPAGMDVPGPRSHQPNDHTPAQSRLPHGC
jgi:integrase/recombinase XerD